MAHTKNQDKAMEMFVWRLVLTLIGLVVAVIFVRDRKEIIDRYRELQSENIFVAWLVKWAFIILMFITFSTVGTIVWLIIRSIQGS